MIGFEYVLLPPLSLHQDSHSASLVVSPAQSTDSPRNFETRPMSPKLSQYEIDREANIARNAALLASLGLTKDRRELFPVQPKQPNLKKVVVPFKRKAEDSVAEERPKVARSDSDDAPTSGTRRSARNAGKTVDYKAGINRGPSESLAARSQKPGNSGPVGVGSGKKMYVVPNDRVT